MRHPRHFSPPFYSSLPAVGRGGSLLRPLSGLTATLRRRYRLESVYANSPCGFCSPRKSSCKHARGATAGFTYANILLVRPWTRLWKSDLWISDFDTSRIYIRTRGEITFVCFVWVCVTRCSVETLHATNRWRLIKRRLCINIVWMILFPWGWLSLRAIEIISLSWISDLSWLISSRRSLRRISSWYVWYYFLIRWVASPPFIIMQSTDTHPLFEQTRRQSFASCRRRSTNNKVSYELTETVKADWQETNEIQINPAYPPFWSDRYTSSDQQCNYSRSVCKIFPRYRVIKWNFIDKVTALCDIYYSYISPFFTSFLLNFILYPSLFLSSILYPSRNPFYT